MESASDQPPVGATKSTRLCPTPSSLVEFNPPSPAVTRSPSHAASVAQRIFQPPKLERKHSSGDLHSRLKTRKILGVGETDNGDIHRSKISQLLGHNEHLYVKFPKGFCLFHVLMATLVTGEGILAFLLPRKYLSLLLEVNSPDSQVAARMAGAGLIGFSVFVWSVQNTTDKYQARSSLRAVLTYHTASLAATLMWCWQDGHLSCRTWTIFGYHALTAAGCLWYHIALGRSSSTNIRKSSSFKDLTSNSGSQTNHSTATTPTAPEPPLSPTLKKQQ